VFSMSNGSNGPIRPISRGPWSIPRPASLSALPVNSLSQTKTVLMLSMRGTVYAQKLPENAERLKERRSNGMPTPPPPLLPGLRSQRLLPLPPSY
jgi:hypothetical protein